MNSHVNNRFNQFLFRYISYYRSKVHYMIHQFYKKYRLIATSKVGRCVAAHVRRGDRIVDIIQQQHKNNSTNNMTQFCIDNIRDTSFIDDFGCFSTPFASVTLQHILDSATKLVPPEVRTLILASDDEAWMISEIEAMYQVRPVWKVYFIEAPKLENTDAERLKSISSEEKYYYMRSHGGTASVVYSGGVVSS